MFLKIKKIVSKKTLKHFRGYLNGGTASLDTPCPLGRTTLSQAKFRLQTIKKPLKHFRV